MPGPGWMRGRPAKALLRKRPDTRRRRVIALALLLASHPTQADLMSPARCAHAKLHFLPETKDRGALLRAAFRDLRVAMEQVRP